MRRLMMKNTPESMAATPEPMKGVASTSGCVKSHMLLSPTIFGQPRPANDTFDRYKTDVPFSYFSP